MRDYVTQRDSYGDEIILTKRELLKRVRLFNKDQKIQDWGLKIIVTGGSETCSYHTRLVGNGIRVAFEVYASGILGLRTTRNLSDEETNLYYQAWDVWCYLGLNSHSL